MLPLQKIRIQIYEHTQDHTLLLAERKQDASAREKMHGDMERSAVRI